MSSHAKSLKGVTLAIGFMAAAVSTSVLAQGIINRPQISAALANEIVGESVAICAKQGYKVWAVVVNTDGVRQALLRGDGAPIHSQDNAYYKAYTAASLTLARRKRLELAKAVAMDPKLLLLDEVMAGLRGADLDAPGVAGQLFG